MTNEEAQELARQHWEFIEKLLLILGIREEQLAIYEFLYRTAMEHGIKHGQEQITGGGHTE